MADNSLVGLHKALVTPKTLQPLAQTGNIFRNAADVTFQTVDGTTNVVDFIAPYVANESDRENLQAYNSPNSVEVYRNFLNWLFETFDVRESDFRAQLLSHLKLAPGMRVLITGCGLGEDIPMVAARLGSTGEVHAQDLSKAMVLEAASKNDRSNILFTISNANHLPYATGYFDAVFHFGGINLFGDVRHAISELDRVCRQGGRVVFGDEGIAKHLCDTEYYEVAVRNIPLWASETPIDLLPHGALDVQLNYVLGNCFYLISFVSGKTFPYMNLDVPHQGTRGGTARTRYFGQLEGVLPETRARLYAKAKALGISAHDLLEQILGDQL